jgi:hypothetical protein
LSFFATDAFHLLWSLLLNLAVLVAAWRLARRFGEDRISIACDTGLLFYLVQYLSVCIPGALGALHALTVTLVAILLSAGIALAGGRGRRRARVRDAGARQAPARHKKTREREARGANQAADAGILSHSRAFMTARVDLAVLFGAVLFVLGYLAALLWNQRSLAVLSNDALTYHLPAAVQWLQTGWMGLYPAWFYNPANSYSPLAGSVFMTWLMAPMGNDAVARFVQVGPMLLLLIGTISLCRRLGASLAGAGLISAALVLSRPFMSQAILAKDDLFVAAFFVLTINAMARPRRSADPAAASSASAEASPRRARASRHSTERRLEFFSTIIACRIGIALGLLLAVKYTVLLSLPILLLMLGRGWNWKRIGIVVLCAIVLAGPWYVRNWILVGNPLYPTDVKLGGWRIFRGMIDVHRSDLLSTPGGVWRVFTGGYYGTTLIMAAVMITGWLGGLASALVQRRWRERLVMTSLFGPVLGIALFAGVAPYGEMRFAYPSLVLVLASAGLALGALPVMAQIGLGVAAMLVGAMTAFANAQQALAFSQAGLIAGAIGLAVALLWRIRMVRTLALACGATVLLMGAATLMFNYTREPHEDRLFGWQQTYGSAADVWNYVREEVPAGDSIAYANTFFVYPLQGYAYSHRVVYAPTRHNLERFTKMPRISGEITGEQIVSRICDMLRSEPDKAQWLRRLRETGATFLVVIKQDPARPDVTITPPEMVFAQQEPSHFTPVFNNDAGTVFRITW